MNLQLSPREDQVYVLWQTGRSNGEIAAQISIDTSSVKKIKQRIRKKTYIEVVPPLTYQKPLRAELAQTQREDIPKILSPMEYKVYLELEKSAKDYRLIAEDMGISREAVKTFVQQIKKKIGSDFSRFFEKRIEPERQTQGYESCLRYMGEVRNNGAKTITCQIKGQITCESSESCFCQDHKEYPQGRFQEKDLLEDRLKDKGFLKIAFQRYALGDEPKNPADMLKLGVNSVGCSDYILKKRAESLAVLIKGARYLVVPLGSDDLKKHSYRENYIDEETGEGGKRTRYPIRDFLEHNGLKPTKTDHYNDEEGKDAYTAYYVMKSSWLCRQLFTALAPE